MKTVRILALAGALLAVALAAGGTTEEGAWFNMENCAICKPMASEPGLMEHMQWENHKIGTGMLSVTAVDPAYEAAWARSHKKMQEAIARVQSGEQLPLCGFCQSMGSLAMAGAKIENVEAKAGHILLVTAADPAVVAKIHAHAQRTLDEYNKMMAAHGGHGHDPHGHDGHAH